MKINMKHVGSIFIILGFSLYLSAYFTKNEGTYDEKLDAIYKGQFKSDGMLVALLGFILFALFDKE